MTTSTKTRKPFFVSTRHPGLIMNRFGVVMVPNGDERGADFYGISFDYVPLRIGCGLLPLADAVQDEAWDTGYRYRYTGRGMNVEQVWSKPTKPTP